MLLSHKYKFIFIKTVKTAGTSIEVDLSKSMGEADIVTPILPPLRGHSPRNFEISDVTHETKVEGPQKFYNHMGAALVRDMIGAAVFESYFKFCVEREPVSKCISYYSMLKNSPDHSDGHDALTWDTFVENGHFPMDADKYVDADGRLIVDRIVRYETLQEELKEISEQTGLPFHGVSTKAKTGFREPIEPTAAQKDRIYEAFAPSLRHCPY